MPHTAFAPATLGSLTLANHIVMAPLTRSRALGNVPNDLMAENYGQRATAGLIITEGTSPSVDGLGYPRIPGLFNQAQVDGWRKITSAVHARGGRIFVQLLHTGRVFHPLNLPAGAEGIAPSAVAAAGEMWTDQQQLQAQPAPRALRTEELGRVRDEFVHSARLAIEAGFDGVEVRQATRWPRPIRRPSTRRVPTGSPTGTPTTRSRTASRSSRSRLRWSTRRATSP